jgi:hypothetical protein
MRQILVVFTLFLLIGCSINPGCSQTPAPSLISEQQAIEIAIKSASAGRPELSGAKIPPKNVRAEQMTLAAALKRVMGDGGIPAGEDPNMTVWVVSMEGIWTDEFPRPTGIPIPEPYRHFSVILNAKTGAEIGSAANP